MPRFLASGKSKSLTASPSQRTQLEDESGGTIESPKRGQGSVFRFDSPGKRQKSPRRRLLSSPMAQKTPDHKTLSPRSTNVRSPSPRPPLAQPSPKRKPANQSELKPKVTEKQIEKKAPRTPRTVQQQSLRGGSPKVLNIPRHQKTSSAASVKSQLTTASNKSSRSLWKRRPVSPAKSKTSTLASGFSPRRKLSLDDSSGSGSRSTDVGPNFFPKTEQKGPPTTVPVTKNRKFGSQASVVSSISGATMCPMRPTTSAVVTQLTPKGRRSPASNLFWSAQRLLAKDDSATQSRQRLVPTSTVRQDRWLLEVQMAISDTKKLGIPAIEDDKPKRVVVTEPKAKNEKAGPMSGDKPAKEEALMHEASRGISIATGASTAYKPVQEKAGPVSGEKPAKEEALMHEASRGISIVTGASTAYYSEYDDDLRASRTDDEMSVGSLEVLFNCLACREVTYGPHPKVLAEVRRKRQLEKANEKKEQDEPLGMTVETKSMDSRVLAPDVVMVVREE